MREERNKGREINQKSTQQSVASSTVEELGRKKAEETEKQDIEKLDG